MSSASRLCARRLQAVFEFTLRTLSLGLMEPASQLASRCGCEALDRTARLGRGPDCPPASPCMHSLHQNSGWHALRPAQHCWTAVLGLSGRNSLSSSVSPAEGWYTLGSAMCRCMPAEIRRCSCIAALAHLLQHAAGQHSLHAPDGQVRC